MFEAKHGKEIVVKVKNRTGLLFDLFKLLSETGVGILAVNGAVSGDDSVIRLVTDDNRRGREALAAKKYVVHEEEVILVRLPHKPGILKRITEALVLEEIDIRLLYATAFVEQEECLLVLHTSNDEHALPRLNRVRPA
jgi:hypothetical protein